MRLHGLANSSRPSKRRKRVGRGPGSKIGKTCGRGVKGAGARSGYKSRARYEGGQLPLYRKLPVRGFSRAGFQRKFGTVNLSDIDGAFEDGETVNLETLREKGFLKSPQHGLKILGNGELTKKVTVEAHAYSEGARAKLTAQGLTFNVIQV